MRKVVRKLILGLGIVFIVLLIVTAIITSVFEEQIGKKLITEINTQLKTELTVGGFGLSLFSDFPNVSADLENVVLEDAFKEVLLEAERVSFQIGLFSLFSSNIKISSVEIENGAVNIHINRHGRANYDIVAAPETSTTENAELGISIEEALLDDMELIYQDEQADQSARWEIKEATFAGQFSSDKFSLTSEADIASHFVQSDEVRTLVGAHIGYDAKVFINMNNGVYDMEKVTLQIEDNIYKVDGFVEVLPDYTDIDLIIKSEEASLESVLKLLPEQYLKDFGDLRSKGKLHFDATINGNVSATETPGIDVNLSLEEGQLSSPRLKDNIREVSFALNYTNGKDQNSRSSAFELSDFKGFFNREMFELGLKVNNFDDPKIDFTMDGVLPLESVFGLFNDPMVSDGSGEVEIKNVHLRGRYKDMQSMSRIKRVNLNGEVEFDDASLVLNKEKITVDRGMLVFENDMLSVEDIKIEGVGSDVNLKGTFYNLLPVLFADTKNSSRAEMNFRATLTSSNLDIGRLVHLTDVSVEKNQVKKSVYDSLKVANTNKRERISNFLKGTFDAKIDRFKYDEIEGTDFIGKLVFENNEMQLEGKTQAMNGNFELEGSMYFEFRPRLEARLICTEIDVKEFFRQSQNFGQNVLRQEHLSGFMNSKIAIYAHWDQEGNFLQDKLRILGGIGVHDGELKNFKMLDDFSDYVKIRDLRHIKFVNMETWLEIRRSTVYLPVFFIQSNAMNLSLSGAQSFDNDINYSMKINAGQVLVNRFKKHNPQLNPVKAQKHGLFNLYFNIFGTLDKFDYKIAPKLVKNEFRRSEHRKREIKFALKKEFGDIQVLEEPEEFKDIPEFDDGGSNEEEEYIDWEIGGDDG